MEVDTKVPTATEAYLEDAVAEYIYARNTIETSFLFWIIQLGWILHKHREELKKHGTWLKFCSDIWLHITQANQQIRMYELSLEHTKIDIIKKLITNWTKLNLFMSLEETQREEIIELAEKWELASDTSAEEFRDAIKDIKWVEIEKEEVEAPVELVATRNPLHEDSKFAAEAIRSAANMSHRAKPFLEAYSSIQKGIEILSETDVALLDQSEREQIVELIKAQVAELSNITSHY